MRFLMLIHDNPSRWEHPTFAHHDGTDPEQVKVWQAEFDALLAEISDSGEYVSGVPLADPKYAKSVVVRDGRTIVSDGPHAETKEQLAGYFIVDVESAERAEEIARRFPSTRFGPIEIRPVMVASGTEM